MNDTQFDTNINFWGRIFVGLGLVLSLAGPVYLFTIEGLWPGWAPILTSILAVAVIFGANWIVEPATYFPMLGVAGTYQAWLVGNISNKLVPASVTAQAATGTKPGTKRSELISVAAISGAVIVHVAMMVVVVALLGNWIITILPELVTQTFDYILPAIVGAVFVQLSFVLRNTMATISALLLAVLFVFVIVPAFPSFSALALPIVVVGTVAVALLSASKQGTKEKQAV